MIQPQVNTIGLVAHWKLWAGLTSIGKVFDYSLNGNLGSTAGTDIKPMYPGFIFNGTDDYIAISDSASLDVQSITLSSWVKLDSSWAAVGYIFSKLEDATPAGEFSYAVNIKDNRTVDFLISSDGGTPTGEKTNDVISTGKWVHIVCTYEYVGATPTYKAYIDGAIVATDGLGTASGTIYQGTGRSAIGVRYDLSDATYRFPFNGNMDNIMIFNTVKSANEVKDIYNQTRWRYNV